MNKWKLFYCFGDPFGAPDTKIGRTENPYVRLGVYQNGYSRTSHIARLDVVYLGEEDVIGRLENRIKQDFYYDIERNDRGHSEWIIGKTVVEIEAVIDIVIYENKFKVEKVRKEFLPLTVNNLESFLEDYQLIKKSEPMHISV